MIKPYKQFLILFLCFLGTINASAQKNAIYKFKAEALGGIVTNDDGFCYGIESAFELPLYGNRNWEYTYNFPTIGFALGAFKFTELNYIEPVIYTNPYFNYPFIHNPGAFSLNVKLGAGLALMGSGNEETGYIFPLTGFLTGGINSEIALQKRYGRPAGQWSLTIGANGKTLHNGHSTKQAKNLIIVDGALGVKFTPNVYPLPIKHPAKPVDKVLALEICAQGGVNQLSRDDRYYYPVGSLNFGFYLPLSNAYRLGLGADGFFNSIYDGTQRTTGNTRYNFIKEDLLVNKIRAGVFLANDLTIDRFIIGLHTGVYAFNPIKVPEYNELGEKNDNLIENWIYTKLVMKYKITPNWMVTSQFKSHLLKVECFEFGFGYAIPEFSRQFKNPFRNIRLKKEDPKELRIEGKRCCN